MPELAKLVLAWPTFHTLNGLAQTEQDNKKKHSNVRVLANHVLAKHGEPNRFASILQPITTTCMNLFKPSQGGPSQCSNKLPGTTGPLWHLTLAASGRSAAFCPQPFV